MKPEGFRRLAWGTLAYVLAVVLWGAYVRATGSGAGCGSHWPSCQGEVVPRSATAETWIEFTHRASSGLAFAAVLALTVWAFRASPRGDPVRKGAALSLSFMITEALLGAGLVLFGLVAKDDSPARAVAMSLHLLNTFLLLASLALTAWWASGGAPPELRGQGPLRAALGLAVLGVLVLGVSGAVTALGDTLFPASSLAEGLRQDLSPTAHLFVRLRVIHPILAVLLGGYVTVVSIAAALSRPGRAVRALSGAVVALFVVQLAAGAINLLLLAPVPLQLLHLLLADLVWIALVLLANAVFAVRTEGTERAALHSVSTPSPERLFAAGRAGEGCAQYASGDNR